MKYLFVGGCPRSGTTALMELLNAHPGIALGKERFKQVKRLEPTHFEPERFLNPGPEETNIKAPEHYARLRAKLDAGSVSYLGDKTPGYYRRLPELAAEFPEARFLMIWRDPVRVASSFEFRVRRAGGGWSPEHDHRNAMLQWNTSLKRIREFVDGGGRCRLMLIHYNWFFSGDVAYLKAVFRFLGLKPDESLAKAYLLAVRKWNRVRKKDLHLTEEQLAYVMREKDEELASWGAAFAARQLSRKLSPELPDAGTTESRIATQYHRFTAVNRLEQLSALGDYRQTGTPAVEQALLDELETLVRRASAIERRADSILEQIKTAEDSAWARLGANLDRVRKPASAKKGERTISQQAADMNHSLKRYRKAIQKLNRKLRR